MKKKVIQFFLCSSCLIMILSTSYSMYNLGPKVSIRAVSYIACASLLVMVIGVISLLYFAFKALKENYKENPNELISISVEITWHYKALPFIVTPILFYWFGIISAASFIAFFSLAFVSPWHEEIRKKNEEIARGSSHSGDERRR